MFYAAAAADLTLLLSSVLATKDSLPRFWIFMYYVSPLTYLVSGMLSTAVANSVVECSLTELTIFNPPSNQTCGDYISPFLGFAGGKIWNPEATADCRYCSISDTNRFLAALSINYSERWRNFGIVLLYAAFNLCMAVLIYWLARVPKNKNKKSKSKSKKGNGGKEKA